MKSLIIYIVILSALSINIFGYESKNDLWLYGGGQIGYSYLATDITDESASKNGSLFGLQTSLLWEREDFAINTTLSWFQVDFESEFVNNVKYELSTRTYSLELSPLWRPHYRWSFGPKFQYIFGEELLVGPALTNNVDNDSTTDKIIGMNVFYNAPWKKYRLRSGLHLLRPLSVGDRSAHIIMLSFELGGLIASKERVIQNPDFKQEASKVIQLDQETINFETNSDELKEDSRIFLNKLGSILRDYPYAWELLNIEGHTDVRGSEAYNKNLSIRRSKSVYNAIIEGGAPKKRIRYEAFGEERPLTKGMTKKDHSINRRVTLEFLGQTQGMTLDPLINEIKKQVREANKKKAN